MNKYKKKIIPYSKPCFLLCLFLSGVLLIHVSSSAYAATPLGEFAASSCDPDYYKSLESRAWLEAQREITQNQNLIFKPDSVLEYTCFDKHLNQMAQSAGDLFSASSRWGTSPPTDIVTALNPIATANDTYLTSNFDHTYLGGRSSNSYSASTSVSAGAYSCEEMKNIWKEAKCIDFIHQGSHDGFFTFSDYESKADMRTLPTACSKTANFQASIDQATGAHTLWIEDPISTYFYLFNREASDACGNDASPRRSKLKTGLLISRTSGTVLKYDEYVCLIPGCYYKPSSKDDGKCVLPPT